ncbi:hypothetical protein K493DRAFT_301418 [Basidiobolus meristosporus CBS 931.73]|uniref:Mei2-like C-terminal RNA recognition motif domain-containing protein n=1 Tax=Basidiobolus meristosporus CBS 931.73 TaxID=1314790 RepID=A0A1Y1YCY2_9FUNG|nr:hypothetical protein K493DRAFT_301418 [Basidiobolus meristosporus CBS 931.73]|eukprot:ORX95586.1 hypothetical protein K493DRAFT_301418 [Basidiobolus meristosporus CBS 931.73]
MLTATIDISSHAGNQASPQKPLDIVVEKNENAIRGSDEIHSTAALALCADNRTGTELLEQPSMPGFIPTFGEDISTDSLAKTKHNPGTYSRFSASIFPNPKGRQHSEKKSLDWGIGRMQGFGSPALNDIHGLSSCYSSSPTHFVSVNLLPQGISPADLEFLKSSGKVWQVLTDRVQDLGMIIVAYYDLRDAIAAVYQLRASEIKEHTAINFVRMSKLVKSTALFSSFKHICDFDGKLLLTFHPPNQFTSNMQLILESCGDIRQISQLPYKSSIVVEFYDVRTAVAAEEKLHRMDRNGIQYQVSFCPTEDPIDRIVIYHDCRDMSNDAFLNESLLDKRKDEAVMFNGIYGKLDAHGMTAPPSYEFTSAGMPYPAQPFQPVSSKPSDLKLVSPIPLGKAFDSKANIWSKTWQLKPNKNYLAASHSPSNMPRYSSNSNSCENVVPSRNQVDVRRITQGLDNRTTFMIRNIPNKYTQKMLLECIDETHKGEYDFVYLRIDFKNHCNVGYAFINFIDVNVMDKDPTYQPKIFHSSGSLKGVEEPFPSSQNAPGNHGNTACWSPLETDC